MTLHDMGTLQTLEAPPLPFKFLTIRLSIDLTLGNLDTSSIPISQQSWLPQSSNSNARATFVHFPIFSTPMYAGSITDTLNRRITLGVALAKTPYPQPSAPRPPTQASGLKTNRMLKCGWAITPFCPRKS